MLSRENPFMILESNEREHKNKVSEVQISPRTLSTGFTEAPHCLLGFVQKQMDCKKIRKSGFVKVESIQISMKGEQASVYQALFTPFKSDSVQVRILCTFSLLEKKLT